MKKDIVYHIVSCIINKHYDVKTILEQKLVDALIYAVVLRKIDNEITTNEKKSRNCIIS